jgi:hypothetical protein
VKLGDFGSAALDGPRRRQPGGALNAFQPVDPDVSRASDTYSFGVLVHSLTRVPAYAEVLVARREAHFRPGVPAGARSELAALIGDCTDPHPERRPTMVEVGQRVRALEDSSPATASDRWRRAVEDAGLTSAFLTQPGVAWSTNARTPVAKQGWKLHASVEEGAAFELLGWLADLTRRGRWRIKVCANWRDVSAIAAGRRGELLAGKTATVYAADERSLREAAELFELRDGLGPPARGETPVPARPGLTYRFGAFVDLTPEREDDAGYVRSPGGQLVPDARGERASQAPSDPYGASAASLRTSDR